MRVASHRLEIETGRHTRVPREEQVYKACTEEVESEEHFVCPWRAYTEIRGRYEALFKGEPTLREIMDSRDQRQLGRFLLEIQSHRDTLLQSHVATQPEGRQSQFTDFFQRITAPSPSSDTQRGVTLPQAEMS